MKLDDLFFTWFANRDINCKNEIITYYVDEGYDADNLKGLYFLLDYFSSYEEFIDYMNKEIPGEELV